jgi:hypothetical protein
MSVFETSGVDVKGPPNDIADPAGDMTYFGFSTGPDVLPSEAKWAVKRIEDVSSNGTRFKTTWAGGSYAPVHIMDNFASLTYS